jgi:sulfane dehydrogenase subunit SoxC
LLMASDPQPIEPQSSSISRRNLLAGAVGAVGATVVGAFAETQGSAQQLPAQATTQLPGAAASELGERAPSVQARRGVNPARQVSRTPLQDLDGTITPADLHFERHHNGIPSIDPATYTLLIHGLVERPLILTLAELRRFPSVTRICFLECSGNYARNAPETTTPRELCGLTSQSEWTGVPLALLMREVRARPAASWFLAEGQDAAVLARSIPLAKAFDDALIAYAQNGEPLRPAQGFPARLLLPGWEGNANVKWLRRIELGDQPFMTREETSRYTDALKNGTARQFSFVMDARSVITAPAHPQRIEPGWLEIRGIAWSGRGRIERVEISSDGGRTWEAAHLQQPVLAKAHTRFHFVWRWDGQPAELMSRAIDETGYVQPTVRELIEARGVGTSYHLNPITGIRIRSDGTVLFRTEEWT